MQVAPQRGDLQLLSLLTATPFPRSFFAKNSSSLHLIIFQRSHNGDLFGRYIDERRIFRDVLSNKDVQIFIVVTIKCFVYSPVCSLLSEDEDPPLLFYSA